MDAQLPQQPQPLPQMQAPEAAPQPTQQSTWVKPLLFALGIVALGVTCLWGFFLFVKSPTSPTTLHTNAKVVLSTSISGSVAFEGYIPADAYISIAEKNDSEGKKEYKEIITGLTPTDGLVNWTWKDATSGENYLLKALLKIKGQTIQESPISKVSAPATGVLINMSSQQIPPAAVVATLSGQINLDGYVPNGATLQVLAKEVNGVYDTVASGIAPADNANWVWVNAKAGTTYEVKAQLIDANGAVISTSDVDTTTAPSTSELLNVYSTAKPTGPSASGISGNITINGTIPSNSYITLGQRPNGASTFTQVASNIAATNGVSFAWNGAQTSLSYDIQAYLWSNGQPFAASNILTVTAPSTFDTLTINAQQPLPAPSSNTLTVSCGQQQSGNFQATVNFNTQNSLKNAVSYQVIATLASQNSQVMNTIVNPANPSTTQSITTTFIFQPGATYYAQYAYATSVGGQMSPLSPSIQFACN